MTEIRHPLIKEAFDIVDREQMYIEAELDAFDRFLTRLTDIPSDVQGTQGTQLEAATVHSTTMAAQYTTGRADAVLDAYRETVMSVPHYEDAYGDTLAQSLSTEFGPTLSLQLVRRNSLTGTTRNALIKTARESRDNRHRFLRVLDREQVALEEASDTLRDIERGYLTITDELSEDSHSAELSQLDSQLEELENRCLKLVENRQETVKNQSAVFRDGKKGSLTDYLYTEMIPTTPVTGTVGRLLERIRHGRQLCLK